MDEKVKEKLLKQIDLIQQMSQNPDISADKLAILTGAMASVAAVLLGGNQFPGEVGLNCQYVAPLPLEDLLALHAARAQRLNRQGEDR